MPDHPRKPDVERPTLDPESLDPSLEPAVGTEAPTIAARQTLTPDGRFKTGKLAGLTMGGAIVVLSWPILVESFLNSFVGLADTMFAAKLGEAQTDAVGGASYVMWFIGLIIMALGVGATALISRSVGKGRMAVANAALGQIMILAVSSGVLVGALIAFMIRPVTAMLSMTPDAAQAFTDYLLVISAGVPFAAVLFCGIACSRGAGDSKSPLIAMIVRNIVNVVISFMLCGIEITRAGETLIASPFDLGVRGIAIGTVAADAVSAAIIVAMAVSGRWSIRLKARWLRPHKITACRILRIGIPNFLETAGMWIGNFMVILMVGALGAGAGGMLGAHIIGIRIEAFSFLPGFAMGTAAATLAGQYLGAGRPDLAKKAVWRCALIAACVMGSIGLIFIFFPHQCVALLSDNPIHLEQAPALVRICGFVQVPFAFALVTRSALRGAGDVKMVMTLTWISTYLIRLPMAYVLSGAALTYTTYTGDEQTVHTILSNPFGFEPSLAALWLALCIELVIRGVLFTTRFLQGGWVNARV